MYAHSLDLDSQGNIWVNYYFGKPERIGVVDANTGEEYWKYDTSAHIWGSVLVADGRVYVGIEDGFLVSAPATKEYDKKNVIETDFGTNVYSSPIAANGVLYVATFTHLYAISKTDKAEKPKE